MQFRLILRRLQTDIIIARVKMLC